MEEINMTTRVKKSTWDTLDNVNYSSVADKGAKGDGATDDTAAFTAAFADSTTVYVPPGTYIVSGVSIPTNGTLFGAGVASILKLKAATANAVVSVGTSGTLRDLQIDGNKSNQVATTAHGVLCANASNSVIHNIKVVNTKGDGINITGAGTLRLGVHNCELTGYAKNGVLVEAGTSIIISECNVHDSDAVASPGDGISISSNGNTIANVELTSNIVTSNIAAGYKLAGNGSKNVIDISIVNCHARLNTTHGFYVLTAERVLISNCVAKANTSDGFRLEGDVQHSRLSTCSAVNNVVFGIREVTAGSSPNFNGFIYSVTQGNGNNTVTKVGANSTVVSI